MPSLADQSSVRTAFTLLTILAVPATFATGIAAQSEASTRAKIEGAWTLNKEQSDDVGKALASAKGSTRDRDGGRLPGGMGGGMGGRGGGRGGRGGGDPEQMQQMRESMTGALEAPTRLTITAASDTISFVEGDGRSLTLPTDNKRQKHQHQGREVESRAKWDDGRLVKETALGNGLKVTETYTVTTERQLVVIAKLEGSRLPSAVTVRRVYDELVAR